MLELTTVGYIPKHWSIIFFTIDFSHCKAPDLSCGKEKDWKWQIWIKTQQLKRKHTHTYRMTKPCQHFEKIQHHGSGWAACSASPPAALVGNSRIFGSDKLIEVVKFQAIKSNEKTSFVLSLSIKVMLKVISSWSLQVFVKKRQNDYNNSPITKPKQSIFATLYLINDTGGFFIVSGHVFSKRIEITPQIHIRNNEKTSCII